MDQMIYPPGPYFYKYWILLKVCGPGNGPDDFTYKSTFLWGFAYYVYVTLRGGVPMGNIFRFRGRGQL